MPGGTEQGNAPADLVERSDQPRLLAGLRLAMLQAWPDDAQSPNWVLQAASLLHDHSSDAVKALAVLRSVEHAHMDAESKRRFIQLRTAIQDIGR